MYQTRLAQDWSDQLVFPYLPSNVFQAITVILLHLNDKLSKSHWWFKQDKEVVMDVQAQIS
jgi:hypothetical protein